ncbi:hypothetical protein V500_09994, partial [Pseudogymnoascus sp. VKM F-4518 (FW-2643)]
MARVSAISRNHRYQAKSKAKIQGRTRSSPRFRGTASNTHPSTSTVTPPPVVGDKVPITGSFASRLRLQDGTPKTLMGLLDESEGGIVVWTFKPRAEDEACDFAAEILSSYHDTSRANMTYYGLTTSSAATNASLQERRDEIDCDLLSDPGGKLLRAMGLRTSEGGGAKEEEARNRRGGGKIGKQREKRKVMRKDRDEKKHSAKVLSAEVEPILLIGLWVYILEEPANSLDEGPFRDMLITARTSQTPAPPQMPHLTAPLSLHPLLKLPHHNPSLASLIIMPMAIKPIPLPHHLVVTPSLLMPLLQHPLNPLKPNHILRPRLLSAPNLTTKKALWIIEKPVRLITVRSAFRRPGWDIERRLAGECPGVESRVHEVRAPRGGVAGHEESGEGGVVGGGGDEEAALGEVGGFVVVAEEGEDVEDAALVDEGCVEGEGDVEGDEAAEEGGAAEGGGGGDGE